MVHPCARLSLSHKGYTTAAVTRKWPLYKEQRTFEREHQLRRKLVRSLTAPSRVMIITLIPTTARPSGNTKCLCSYCERFSEARLRRLRLESQCDLWGDVEYRGPSFGLEAIYDDVESNLDRPALVEEVGAQEERVALHLN